ncbi:methyltransferase domain-containing protein [Colletotrichum paranaense]|uniref:Methyltransferase domain-containing protein n=1 Tax=Colletotrichum paranaense TaxID=1914294 RepID=A0ABQ9STJ5_9PEZI|nr:methyltransferase domain-containing protein [Colletotrichum paranaense]KAK1542846.1 methyltransferase domain-containing protein [Colletotrichum paranaense]
MAENAQNPAEDDRTDDDTSSIGGSSVEESTASLRSSILDYRRENGRTYHRVSDGSYLAPNDEQEQDRLDFSHHLWKLTYDGEPCNCPKKTGAKRVLDIGTGTGIWALDYADDNPESFVLGVDLSPIQPKFVPPNCQFEVDDVEKEWTWSEAFDFIFSRSMNAAFKDRAEFVAKAFENLEPGGYLEIQDNVFPLLCTDGTMPEDSLIYQWSKLIMEGTDLIGQPLNDAPKFKKMLEDAGFEDVQERKEIWPIGTWPERGTKEHELGMWCRSITMESLEALSLALFTRVLGWSREETVVFCAGAREELRQQKVHAYFDVYATWGRKPEKQDESQEGPAGVSAV